MEDRFDKWDKWLDVVKSEITSLSINRNIFWKVQEIILNNPKIQKPSSFYEFLVSVYATSALMGIRRQIKIDRDSISFARLLKEIYNAPEVLSRKRYVALYEGSTVERFGDRDFDRFAGEAGSHFDPNIAKSDIEKLKAKAQECEKYADRRIAHFDKRAINKLIAVKEIDNCIDFLDELTKKYYSLFRAIALVSILPTCQYDWKAIFREPWLP